jgi:hypothetical protein
MKSIYTIASEKEIALIKSAGISDSDLNRPHLSVNEMEGETEIVLSSGARVTIYDAVEPLVELPGTWKKMKNRAIFDNGGGITLQLGNFAHHYSDPKQAATDWTVYQQTKDTDGWEGHQEEAADLDPSYDEIRNGGYRVMDADDITKMIDDCEEETSWNNINSFVAAVAEGLNL